MYKLLTLGFGFALVTTGALAQTTGSIPTLNQSEARTLPQLAQSDMGLLLVQNEGRGGSGWDRGPRNWQSGRDDDADDNDQDHGQGGGRGRGFGPRSGSGSGGGVGGGMMMRMHEQMMGRMGGARFRIRKGDTAIDVRCPAQAQMSACVDAIGQVLDKMGGILDLNPRRDHLPDAGADALDSKSLIDGLNMDRSGSADY